MLYPDRKTFLICAIYLLFYIMRFTRNSRDDSYQKYRDYHKNLRLGRKTGENIHILLWTPSFFSEHFIDKTYFQNINCEITSCIITDQRDLLESVTHFDAILFHVGSPTQDSPPTQRSVHQQYIMSVQQSPINTIHDFSPDYGIYNMTMTYRLDSDIVWPYAVIEDTITGQQTAPALGKSVPVWRTPDVNYSDPKILETVKRKTKMGAWFVSNCNKDAKTDRLVKAMQKHMQIDVYGNCGTLHSRRFTSYSQQILENDYKFYMAFENSLCVDYVSEKLFDNLKRLIIPVVFGGADYNKFAPPKSYIDVNDFESVETLIDYLKFLDQHPEEYIKYFWWKKFYRVKEATPFCDLCVKLHALDYEYDHRQEYKNIREWWYGDSCKREERIKF